MHACAALPSASVALPPTSSPPPMQSSHPPQVRCKAAGAPKSVLEQGTEALPASLEWGEVLLSVRYAPVNPADL